MKAKVKEQILGFYKDKRGETRPITKSAAELNRRKVIQNPHQLHALAPGQLKKVDDTAERLEKILEKLTISENELETLKETQIVHNTSESGNDFYYTEKSMVKFSLFEREEFPLC